MSENISTLHIHLMKQKKSELRELYKELSGEAAESTWTNDELIGKITSIYDLSRVVQSWSKKINAFNTSLSIYKILENNSRKRNFMSDLLAEVDEDVLESLKKGEYGGNLGKKPKLIEMIESDSGYYFMFALRGRKKRILDGLKMKEITQPSFVILRVDDSKGTLEIRGQKTQGEKCFKVLKSFLSLPGEISFKQVEIKDKAGVLALCAKLNGQPVRASLQDDDEQELAKADLVAKPDSNIYDTESYQKFEEEGYYDSAGGIDFKYRTKLYTIYIGFTTGTFWFRSGTVDEDVIKKVVSEASRL